DEHEIDGHGQVKSSHNGAAGVAGIRMVIEAHGFPFREPEFASGKCQLYVRFVQRTERLFALAEVLRGRRTGVTAEALAERFGVTVRTIYRDLDTLRAADLPLTAERGRGGGYALDKSYTLPPVNFTAREAALVIALGRFAIDMR